MIKITVGFWTNERKKKDEAWLRGAVWAKKQGPLPPVEGVPFNGPFDLMWAIHKVLKRAGVKLFPVPGPVIKEDR
jgi:hypothetical protein